MIVPTKFLLIIKRTLKDFLVEIFYGIRRMMSFSRVQRNSSINYYEIFIYVFFGKVKDESGKWSQG